MALSDIGLLRLGRCEVREDFIAEPQLKGWKSTAYKVLLLAPKLLFSGIGWVVGFSLGYNLGAGVGDALGTGIGCTISYGIEYLMKKYLFKLECFEGATFYDNPLLIKRVKEASILCMGSFVGGLLFNPAYKWTSSLSTFGDWHLSHALATGLIAATGFAAGTSLARVGYTLAKDKEEALSKKNLVQDMKTAGLIIWPAEAAFVGTATAVFGSKFLLTKAGDTLIQETLKGGSAVLIGGSAGAVIQDRAIEPYLFSR
jgi:hypothetical protein